MVEAASSWYLLRFLTSAGHLEDFVGPLQKFYQLLDLHHFISLFSSRTDSSLKNERKDKNTGPSRKKWLPRPAENKANRDKPKSFSAVRYSPWW